MYNQYISLFDKMKKNIVFLPCRKGSQRVPNKNTRPFAGIEGGLLRIKLEQLLTCDKIDKIYLSSDDEVVLNIGKSMNNNRIIIDKRPDYLCQSSTSTDDVIRYVPELIKEDATIIWTHVTSPFLKAETYDKMIDSYYNNLSKYDSLMSVNELRTFIWNKDGAINYDRDKEKWPRTQTLEPWYEINSGAFIADRSIYTQLHDRVGKHVYPYVTTKMESFDIDWPEDFEMAEMIYRTIQK